jgi:hypothetical protein
MKLKTLKLNKNLSTPKGKVLMGSIVNIECDSNGVPLNQFWRARVKDSKIDYCVEFYNDLNQKNKKEK